MLTIQEKPLAEKMRPRTLDEIIGQDGIIGKDSAFYRLLEKKSLIPSIVLVGPPGVGKTSIAQVIANCGGYAFERLSGVLDGAAEIRKVVSKAEKLLLEKNTRTVVLVDEIHRFNRAQQDGFLPHVESGLISIIGQTTENVSFRLRSALLSRLRVLELKPLNKEDIKTLVKNALSDKERGLGAMSLEIKDEALEYIATLAGADARRALNALEWSTALLNTGDTIEKKIVEEAFGKQPQVFDQAGDQHYDCISAFIKSLRGSDPDAALYYMLRALEGGEDPQFITRRMIIFASEDVGCDPRALQMAVACAQAVEIVGLGEGKIVMANVAVYLAMAAKSNASYKALREMERIVSNNPGLEIPKRLKNAPSKLMKEMGNSIGYRYPHDYPQGFVAERYLPEELIGLSVYQPTDRGLEIKIRERLEYFKNQIKDNKQ